MYCVGFQDCFKRTIFPMGKYHKKDINKWQDRGYVELTNKGRGMKSVLYQIMTIENS